MKYKLSPIQEGLLPHAVMIEPYNPEWPIMANKAAQALKQALGDNIVIIEHIGSTAIPGLAAKAVIDLMPIVQDINKLEGQKEDVLRLGYMWYDEFGIEGRRFCTLTSDTGVRLIHLHFYQTGNDHIKRHLAFRDYLLAHPTIAQQYMEEKFRAATLYPNDSMAYNDEKSAWIKHYEQEALRWYKMTMGE